MHEVFVDSKIGQIHIAQEVLAIISGTAAMEVEGVVTGNAPNMSSRVAKRNFAKGIKISFEEGKVKADMDIAVKYGHKLHEVASEVQGRVRTAIETMVGMQVMEINVNVTILRFDNPALQKRR